MKKTFALFIVALLTLTYVQAQDGWVAHKGDNRISVKFPSDPKEVVVGSFMGVSKDSVICIFTIVDFVQVANLDSVALAPIKATPEFADQLKTGMKQGLPNVELSDFKIGTWKGFTSYTATGVDPKKKKYDIFMFIIGNKLYSLSTVTAEKISMADRDKFFASIQLSN